MVSKYRHLKEQCIALRKNGNSLKDVESALGVPRSILSYWFKNIQLTKAQKNKLDKRWRNALVTAREKASAWHRQQRLNRIAAAETSATISLSRLPRNSIEVQELALAMLYLGEGMKKSDNTCLGNSDPRIVRYFVHSINQLYGVPLEKMQCYLHLRADQDGEKCIDFWSKVTEIPRMNFKKPIYDSRTKGRKTYDHYQGVCIVHCGNVAIVRKLMYIADMFCAKTAPERGAVSSSGRARH